MIECTSFKEHKTGSLMGFADFFVPKWGIHLYNCSVFENEDQKWINFPSKKYTDKEGEEKYFPYIRFENPEHKKGFIEQANSAIKIYREKLND